MKSGVLVIKGSGGGGLGDRIRAVLVGFIYADLSGRSVFVDWRDGLYGPEGMNVFDHLFRISNLPVLDELPLSAMTKPAAWSSRLAQSMDQVWREDGNTRWDRADAIARYSFDLGSRSHPEAVLVMWEFDQLDQMRPHLTEEQRALDAESLLTWAYRRFMSPLESIEQEVTDCFKGINGTTVGVHVRATREASQQKGAIPLTSYYRILDKLLARENVARVVVCTDNSEVEGELMKRYPMAWSRRKWFARPGDSLHLNEACPDKLQLAKDAVVDMLMLARCDWQVTVQSSSFSMMARIMSTAPENRHIQLAPHTSLKSRFARRLGNILGR